MTHLEMRSLRLHWRLASLRTALAYLAGWGFPLMVLVGLMVGSGR